MINARDMESEEYLNIKLSIRVWKVLKI